MKRTKEQPLKTSKYKLSQDDIDFIEGKVRHGLIYQIHFILSIIMARL